MSEYALKLNNITKTYPGVVALNDISLNVEKGRVHAIVGENGAGKSTMMKLISGATTPNDGNLEIFGKNYKQMTPHLSRELGIEVVYQEFNLVPSLSVAENIFLGAYPGNNIFPNFKEMVKKTKEVFDSMQVDINPHMKVQDLSTSYCQLVEIAKAISKDVKILILDEPTAALTVSETEILFDLMRRLKKKGTTILYVSHRLSEIFDVCEDVTVFRDGEVIETNTTKGIDRKQLVKLMVGRELDETYPKKTNKIGERILEIKDLSGMGVEDISFELYKGEILGFAGLVGSGRTEIARMIFGADKPESGEIILKGKNIKINNPSQACNYSFGFVPEDRKTQGVLQNLSIRQNITLSILKVISKFGFLNFKKEDEILNKHKDSLRIKTPSFKQLVKNLSGGNQQKVVLSKWLARSCEILIVDEPTRGIDVGAKKEIYTILNDLTEKGVSIIMISSEMPELIGMADRIMVMSEGRATGFLNRDEFNQEKILELASLEFKPEEI